MWFCMCPVYPSFQISNQVNTLNLEHTVSQWGQTKFLFYALGKNNIMSNLVTTAELHQSHVFKYHAVRNVGQVLFSRFAVESNSMPIVWTFCLTFGFATLHNRPLYFGEV
jgi:hypothetical protein